MLHLPLPLTLHRCRRPTGFYCDFARVAGREILRETFNDFFNDRVGGRIRSTGGPAAPHALPLFSALELIALLRDRDWLDEALRTIIQFRWRKHAPRRGLTAERPTEDASGVLPRRDASGSNLEMHFCAECKSDVVQNGLTQEAAS